MKEILKKAFMPIFLAIVGGGICGRMVYKIYYLENEFSYEDNLIYLIQSGAYSSYDSMRINSTSYDYVYYEEDNLYKTVIAIVKNKDNIEKVKKIYNDDIKVSKYYIKDKILNEEINNYDKILLNEKDDIKAKEIIIKMLNLYNGNVDTKLIKVS